METEENPYRYHVQWYDAIIEDIEDETEKKEEIRIYSEQKTFTTLTPFESICDVETLPRRLCKIIKPFEDFVTDDGYIEYVVIVTNTKTNKTNKYRVTFNRTITYNIEAEVLP